MKKVVLFVLLLIGVCPFVFMDTARADNLKCAILVDANTGSKKYIGMDGKEIAGENAYQTLRSQCAWGNAQGLCAKRLTEKSRETYTFAPQDDPRISNYHQDCAASDKLYLTGGCAASSVINARAFWEITNPNEVDLNSLGESQKNELIQSITSDSTAKEGSYLDVASGQLMTVRYVDNIYYSNSKPYNYVKFVTSQIDNLCNAVRANGNSGYASGYFNSHSRVLFDTLTVEHNVRSMSLEQVRNAVSGNGGLLLSVKSPCPFTSGNHFITIMGYDSSKGYLVIHGSQGRGGQYPSGWYGDDVISQCISGSGINNGIWTLHPDACIQTVFVSQGCSCDTNTGEYVYTRTQGGKTTTEKCNPATDKDKCSGFIKNHSCPQTCSKTCSNNNGVYTCKDGNTCDENKYRRECTHSCQTPAESGDGNYYCKESSPGKGDGPVCDEAKYTKQCKCDEWENKCENNQNPTDPDCEKYNKYCVDCTPNVHMPSTCNDFDIDSNEKGVISDIAQSNAGNYSCQSASDVPRDQVKACVINRNDASDKSFNATASSGIDGNNPYCQVWCKESYDFGVPTARTTRSGGYFTLNASINGTRDCYVSGKNDPSKGIDTTLFRQNIKDLTEQMLNNYNEYIKYRTALEDSLDYSGTYYTGSYTYTNRRGNTRCHHNVDVCDYHAVNEFSYPTLHATFDSSFMLTNIYSTSTSVSKNVNGEVTQARGSGYVRKGGRCYDGDCHVGSAEQIRSYLNGQLSKYEKAYLANLADIKNKTKLYNACSGSIVNPSDTSLNVIGWENKMNDWSSNGPKMYFNYKEDYIRNFNKELKASYSKGSSTEMYCFGDTDATYKCVSGGSANNIANATTSMNLVYCSAEGCALKSVLVGKSNWIQKSKTQHATYVPENEIEVLSQYGTIRYHSPSCSGHDCLYTTLPIEAIPVSLIRESGVFPFVLSYANVGQSNQDNTPGRILNKGNAKTVVTAYEEKVKSGEYKKCKIDSLKQTAGYVCHYLVDCDECTFKCDPDGTCYFDEEEKCDDGHCIFECKDCVFDGDHATYSFRPVSLTNLFPNSSTNGQLKPGQTSRTASSSYNWTNKYKGELTKKIIESGYSRGNIKLLGGDETYSESEYSYKLTASNLANIKGYNKLVGTFTNTTIPSSYISLSNNKGNNKNSSVYCSTVNVNGLEYSVKCNSAFLDILDKNNRFATETKRPKIENRFILFTDLIKVDSDLSKSCANNSCINRANSIGPAWK